MTYPTPPGISHVATVEDETVEGVEFTLLHVEPSQTGAFAAAVAEALGLKPYLAIVVHNTGADPINNVESAQPIPPQALLALTEAYRNFSDPIAKPE